MASATHYRIPVTRESCHVDGTTWSLAQWEELDFSKAEFCEKASVTLVLLGAAAPLDLHLRVPVKDGDTYHRVRANCGLYRGIPLKRFEKTGDSWEAVYSRA